MLFSINVKGSYMSLEMRALSCRFAVTRELFVVSINSCLPSYRRNSASLVCGGNAHDFHLNARHHVFSQLFFKVIDFQPVLPDGLEQWLSCLYIQLK